MKRLKLSYPSMRSRITTTTIYAVIISVIAYGLFPVFYANNTFALSLTTLWFALTGYMVAKAGLLIWLPFGKRKITWYWRGPIVAGLFNLLPVLFALPFVSAVLSSNDWSSHLSPWLLPALGGLVGLGMDLFATLFGGDGPACLFADSE